MIPDMDIKVFNDKDDAIRSPTFQNELRQRLSRWVDLAPSDSSAVFFVKRCANGFKGLLKIRSREVRIVAGCIAPTLSELMDRVGDETCRQITAWRNARFLPV
jgi:hypothetical protein